jgi:hypothetical protein
VARDPVAIGGVVAVGFMDENRVIVGSHSGLGVFDVHTGERIEWTHGEDYNWYQGDRPLSGIRPTTPRDYAVVCWQDPAARL